MSNALFPTLPGLTWNIVKSPRFNTKVQTAVDMSELRVSYANTPVWDFALTYEFLRQGTFRGTPREELEELGGFFLLRQGKWDSFLFLDPSDSGVVGQQFAAGNGNTANFQLTRAFGGFREQVSQLTVPPQVYANGVLLTSPADYNVSATGLVSFANAPAVSANLAWTGGFYFRCRFNEDAQDYNQFMQNLWELRTLTFKASLGTKL